MKVRMQVSQASPQALSQEKPTSNDGIIEIRLQGATQVQTPSTRQAHPSSPSPKSHPQAQVEPRYTSVPIIPTLTITTRNVQCAYMQGDISYYTKREPSEISEGDLTGGEVIVLQLGSRNLRIGLAKDALPRTIPHVIAHRNASFPMEPQCQATVTEEELQERLAARYKQARKKPPPNIYPSVLSYNKASTPHSIPAHNDAYGIDWRKTDDAPFITSNAALRINPEEPYIRRWPLRRGRFNHLQYKSYREILGDLDKIWTGAIEGELKIRQCDFGKYNLVLVVSDCISRSELRALTELALRTMGFRAVSFILESVAGTFGAGVSSACVLDIGAQKVSVCCVEDGQLLPDSRVNLEYGGDEVARLFLQILNVHHFPYTACDLAHLLDWELVNDLKERLCTMDEEDISSQIYEAHVRDPGKATKVYPFKVFEERIIAPLALFEPGAPLLYKMRPDEDKEGWDESEHDDEIKDGQVQDREEKERIGANLKENEKSSKGAHRASFHNLYMGIADASDVYYALEPDQGITAEMAIASSTDQFADAGAEGEKTDMMQDHPLLFCEWGTCHQQLSDVGEAFNHLQESHMIDEDRPCEWAGCKEHPGDHISWLCHLANHFQMAALRQRTFGGIPNNEEPITTKIAATTTIVTPPLPSTLRQARLSLEQAIVASLDSLDPANNPERVKKMLGSFLIIGNGHRFARFIASLEERLYARYPDYSIEFVLGGGLGSVSSAKENLILDAGIVAWKGGAVHSKLECVQDAWITRREFDAAGIRIFRDRLSFPLPSS